MTIKDLFKSYLAKETTAIEAIRILSGAFAPETAIDILAMINQITRLESGDMDVEVFKDMYEL